MLFFRMGYIQIAKWIGSLFSEYAQELLDDRGNNIYKTTKGNALI